MWETECGLEFQLLDLDPLPEPISNPKPQLSDSILLPDLIMTPVSSPDFNLFSESTLDPVPIHNEIESPIFDDHFIELDHSYF